MTLLIFLIVLSILIFVHEFGHFIVAKKSGVKVEEFALGFPPRIWSKKIGETVYSINAVPFGGYVRLWGEDTPVAKDRGRSFYYKSKLVRAMVSVAGIGMNFLLAVLAFSVVVWFTGVPKDLESVKITRVYPDSPALVGGVMAGDYVVAVGGERVRSAEEFVGLIGSRRGQEVALGVLRDGEGFNVVVWPRENPPEGQGALGVGITDTEFVQIPFWKRPFVALVEGARQTGWGAYQIVVAVGGMIGGLVRGIAPQDVTGPVGIFQVTREAARLGVLPLLSLVGILSVNLAVLNVLPFPALDGGRLLFIFIEVLFGKRVAPRFERVVHMVGFVILLGLIVLISVRDVARVLLGNFSSFLPL